MSIIVRDKNSLSKGYAPVSAYSKEYDKIMIALISSDYIVKNHFEEIVNNFPQLKIFNANDEIIRDEENYNQFDQICFCDFEITAYTSMKISKYAPEKKIQFSDLYSLKNYLIKLKNILN